MYHYGLFYYVTNWTFNKKIFFQFIPESVRYLQAAGKYEEAERLLENIAIENGQCEREKKRKTLLKKKINNHNPKVFFVVCLSFLHGTTMPAGSLERTEHTSTESERARFSDIWDAKHKNFEKKR